MATPDTLIAALGHRLRTPLQLDKGVCALFDGEREVAIIEMPPAGDVVIVHCLVKVTADAGLHARLLRLNFDLAAMHGFWLALDNDDQVRLCGELPRSSLDETRFMQWIEGFVRQNNDMPALLGPRSAAPGPIPAGLRPSL